MYFKKTFFVNFVFFSDEPNDHKWIFLRFGPFTTYGGNDWTRVRQKDVLGKIISGKMKIVAFVIFF